MSGMLRRHPEATIAAVHGYADTLGDTGEGAQRTPEELLEQVFSALQQTHAGDRYQPNGQLGRFETEFRATTSQPATESFARLRGAAARYGLSRPGRRGTKPGNGTRR